jgi:hypothetical protein
MERIGEALRRAIVERSLSDGTGNLEEIETACCLCGAPIRAYRLHTQHGKAYQSTDVCRPCKDEWVRESRACTHCGRPMVDTFDPIRKAEALQCLTCDTLPEEERSKRAAFHKWEYITPPRYREFSAGLCPCPEKHAEVMAWAFSDIGLLLRGPSGLGKTTSLFQLLRRLLEEGRTVVYLDSHKLAHSVSMFGENAAEGVRLMEKLVEPDVLAFDDVGKAVFTDRMLSELFGVIERRTAAKRPILVTTNDSETSLTQRMRNGDTGAALIRRIREFTREVVYK